MANVELATAYVSLVPTMQGVQGKVAEALLPAGAEADKAGKSSGGMFAAGFGGVLGAAAIGVAATGAAVAGAAGGLYKVGAIFDDVTDTIRVGTGESGAALDGLVGIAQQVGTSVPTSFEAAGQTVSDLNQRLGLSGDTLSTVAQQYIQAGNILGETVDINTTTAAFSAFGIEGANVEGAMDTLFRVSQATGVGLNDLASQVQTSAAPLRNLGFGFEETASLAGVLSKAGLNGSAVMASMGKGLVTLAKAGEEPQAAFKRVTGELGDFVKSGNTAGALNLASKVFGTKGASQFVGALQSGKINLEDLSGSAGLTGDTILGLGKETADAAESWELLKNKALLALEPMGTAVFNFAGTQLGFLADNMDGIVANIANFATEAGRVVAVLTSGDFSGPIFGMEEDSGFVDFLFDLREGLINTGTAITNAGSFLKADLLPALLSFGAFLVENQATIANWATGIAVLMIPVFVRLAAAAVTSAATQVAAWATSGAGAISAAATYVVSSYTMIGRWVAMGAAAVASGALTVAIWALYAAEAIKGAAIYAAQSARVVIAWVVMSAAATANAVVMATGWVVGVVVPAAAALVSFLAGVAGIVAGWVVMAAGAMVNAVVMAAAWFVALGPIGWVTAAVLGLVALIVANWSSVARFTGEAWANVTRFVSDGVRNAVSFVSGMGGQILGAVGNFGGLLVDSGRALIQGFIDGISGMIGAVTGAVGGVLGAVADFFPHSPAKKGPFSGRGYTSHSGAALAGDFADGISGQRARVERAAAGITSAAVLSGSASAGASMAAASPGGLGAGGGVTQIIQPAPGMSEETIGRVAANSLNYHLRMA